jgi:serine/threonine protein kinase/TolB-like protein
VGGPPPPPPLVHSSGQVADFRTARATLTLLERKRLSPAKARPLIAQRAVRVRRKLEKLASAPASFPPSVPDVRAQLEYALGSMYTIERELGGGGMSRVYVARDVALGRDVVIKVLAPELAEGLSAERFEREAHLAARLQHPHMVPVITAGVAGGLPYYTMPFIAGESLRARMARGRIELPVAVKVLSDVARALDYAHRQCVVHRDIKPENILLSDGIAVVTDFGIAKALSAAKTPAPGGTLTQLGTSLGTPAYMAPEQAVGDAVDARADLYAWGVVAYEMLAGVHPFAQKTTAQQLIAAHIAECPEPLPARAPEVPAPLAALVMRCLEKEPSARPGDASSIVATLDATHLLDGHHQPSATHAHARTRGRNRAAVLSGAGVVALLALGAAVLGLRHHASLRHAPGSPSSSAAAAGRAPITTVAVLPFVNTGGDAKDEYFSDGMTDELAHALSRLPSLRVAGRTSSYAYKGKDVPAQQIGRTLHVGGIVEGTVRRAGDRLRITAELTSASDGLVVWSDSYESSATDVFQVQDQFTREIVSALEPALHGATAATVADSSRGTADPAAYDLYLKGRYYFAKRGGENVQRSIGYFRQAIERDPHFARALVALAMAYQVLPDYVTTNTDSVEALASASVGRALALEPALADAHLVRCGIEHAAVHFAAAERECRAAVMLEPNDPTAHMWRAENLAWMGQLPEAMLEVGKARGLDPLSPIIAAEESQDIYMTRDFSRARVENARAIEMDSTLTVNLLAAALENTFSGHADQGVARAEQAYRDDPSLPGTLGALVLSYAAAGRWTDAERVRAQIARAHEQRRPRKGDALSYDDLVSALAFGIPPGQRASVIQRIDWTDLVSIMLGSCDPILDPLKTDPAFARVADRLGMTMCTDVTPWPVRPPPT